MTYLTIPEPNHAHLIRVAFKKTIFAKPKEARTPLSLVIRSRSGGGKSSLALRWAEEYLRMTGRLNDEYIDHLLEEHICYTPYDTEKVLEHSLFCDKNVRVMINMEAREALDSRESMSEFNKNFTRAINLSRSIRPLALIFCTQRIGDFDVRIRETVGLYASIKSYVTSSGRMILPRVTYYSLTRRILESKKGFEQAKLEPVIIIYNGRRYYAECEWNLPICFDKFRELDKERKIGIMIKKSGDLQKDILDQLSRELSYDSRTSYILEFLETCVKKKIGSRVSKKQLYDFYKEFVNFDASKIPDFPDFITKVLKICDIKYKGVFKDSGAFIENMALK